MLVQASQSTASRAWALRQQRVQVLHSLGLQRMVGQGRVLAPPLRVSDNTPAVSTSNSLRVLSDLITQQSLDTEQFSSYEQIASVLDVPVATVRNMAYKRKGLLSLTADQVRDAISKVAQVVDVPLEKARQMCIIQPSLLTEPERNAEVLANGLKLICFDLKAEKEEIVELIINNPSILHGRELRLSVADMANLALMREPKSRIVD